MRGEKEEKKRNKNTSYAQIFDAPCARRRIALAKNQSIPPTCAKKETPNFKTQCAGLSYLII